MTPVRIRVAPLLNQKLFWKRSHLVQYMTNYPEVEYEHLSIKFRDVEDTWVPDRGCKCIVFESDSYHFVEYLEDADEILSGDRFNSITSDNKDEYECNVCGDKGCNVRYNSNFLTLHEDCKEEFIGMVRSFLEENSQTVLSESI